MGVAASLPRGSIVLVSLDPKVGREQGKIRPAVVVSRDAANRQALTLGGVITVAPITSNTDRVLSFQALIDAHGIRGKAQAEQIRSVSVSRIVRTLGRVTSEQLAALDEALAVHLDLVR